MRDRNGCVAMLNNTAVPLAVLTRDRQARGRLLKLLTNGPVDASVAAGVMQRDDATATRLIDSLVADGLVERVDASLCLPGG